MNSSLPTAERLKELAGKVEATVAAAVRTIDGKPYMTDAKGKLIPQELVKPLDQLMDQTVRRFIAYARDLSEQIARFRGHCFDDLSAFLELVADKYGTRIGSEKGNATLTSFDGCLKVVFQVQDRLSFGPEIAAAKKLVDECLGEWSTDAHPVIRDIVNRAFNVDQQGTISRTDIFTLLRTEVDDDRWKRAMTAIHDSMRIIGSAIYIRFYWRPEPTAKWTGITIDLASAS